MKILTKIILFILAILLIACQSIETKPQKDLTKYVNTLIGTKPWTKTIQLAGPELAEGHTFPGVCPPFAMTEWTAQTCTGDIPYWYKEGDKSVIQGFRATHYPSGAVMADYASFTIMPITGRLNTSPELRQSHFNHDTEIALPQYYSVFLDDYKIKTELTATSRSGFFQFTFPHSDESYIILDFFKDAGAFEVNNQKNEISGYSLNRGQGSPDNFKGYFVVQFEKNFYSFDKKNDSAMPNTDICSWVKFKTSNDETVRVKIGTSFISVDQARDNLNREIPNWDFNKTINKTKDEWNVELNKILVETENQKDKTIFYTALYHALLLPRDFSEYGRYFSPYDGKIHKGVAFTDYSLWDTFRSEHPLLLLLVPDKVNAMITSLLNSYDEAGWIPKWPNPGYSNVMMGSHADAVIADAYIKGVRNYDIEKAYKAMIKNSNKKGTGKYAGRVGIVEYNNLGFVPGDQYGECVARTLEFAYGDYCIAQFAKALGKNNDYEKYIAKSKYYINVLDPETKLIRGKNSDGSWQSANNRMISVWAGQTQKSLDIYKWNHTFLVPHDVTGLIKFFGSQNNFVDKLDTFFTSGYYYVGDEFSMHAPYLYNYGGTPWKTQNLIRDILSFNFDVGPDGLCGNEDCGQMSAWYIFGALGFFPVCPANDSYALTSPIFDKVLFTLPNGKHLNIIAENNSKSNKYIQSVYLNGDELKISSIQHKDIMNGGELKFILGNKPNRNWSSTESESPVLAVKDVKYLPVPYIKKGEKTFNKSTKIELSSYSKDTKLFYTLDKSVPNENSQKYSEPIIITENTTLRFRSYKKGHKPSSIISADFFKVPQGRTISINTKYSEKYNGGGDFGLIDCRRGKNFFFSDKWQGYEVVDCDAVVQYEKFKKINKVSVGCLQDINNWIFFPKAIEIYTSMDGKNYKHEKTIQYAIDKPQTSEILTKDFSATLDTEAKYLKIIVRNSGSCPEWHDYKGNKAWIFIDEIVID